MAKKKDSEKASQNSDSNKQEKNETNDDDEPNFSDPEGFVDSITDEELLGDILKQKPKETDGVESVVVVDGVPQVGPERLEKLSSVISKIFRKVGPIVNEYYPKNENGLTKGYEAIPDEWEAPEPQPYKEQGNLHYHLLEPDAFDQYCLIIAKDSTVQIWLNSSPEPIKLEDRVRWSEAYVNWSPLGSYIATYHKKGLALWGGPTFQQIMRFTHIGVQFIDFSPLEKYLVTYSPQVDDPQGDQKKLIIWDVRTGLEKRDFSPGGLNIWPIFRWSHDDKYFARISTDMLSVYETPSFGLLDKKSIKITGIRDFSWSPTDNVLAYWVAEDKDVPARVTLLEIPSRNETRAKNLFNVADCKMHWQKSGDYLCVNVNRYSKIIRREKNEIKYSGMYYNFEIFHMREKQIPVDSVEIKEPIHAFAWEPVGSKFAIIHGDTPNISVSFYGVKTGQAPSLLKRFEKKSCNSLFWSPAGQFIVLAGLRNLGGSLEFVDTNDFVIMNATDHFAASEVEWDPTGRYVVTAVSYWKTKIDTGYWIWSFQGKILKRINIEMFCSLLWRPRPNSLLSIKQQAEIKKNLKKYSSQFESKDRLRMSKASKELIEKRKKLMKEFAEYRNKRVEQWQEQKKRRLELRNHIDTDELDSDTKNVEEEVVEFFIKEEISVID
uniref:Eukaryotic translation initiation factor 3 subunit B n=1 Tax=Timema cristinae TaxID=61476 RepID=A0A7R9CXJ0_TIMCR|nr:unnamed protein product [Timema cristinae]